MTQGSKTVTGSDQEFRSGPNRPLTPEDQIRKVVMYGMIQAGEIFRKDPDLEECYLILSPSTDRLPDVIFARRQVIEGETERAITYKSPFHGVDMRGMTKEEFLALGRFPKPTKPNPQDQTEAIVQWVAQRYGVEIAERPIVEIKKAPVINNPVRKAMPPLVAGPKNRNITEAVVAAALLASDPLSDSELSSVPEISESGEVTPIFAPKPTSELLRVALCVESKLAMHFGSSSNGEECRVGFWVEDGEIKFEVSALDDSNRESWPNRDAEVVMAVNKKELKTDEGLNGLRENLMTVLGSNFGLGRSTSVVSGGIPHARAGFEDGVVAAPSR